MNVLDRIENTKIVPVVVIEKVEDAIPTAKALLAGGIDAMEITFRTEAAQDAISAVAASCPDMLVGAGTIVTLAQCKQAIAAGAKFIVSPGYCEEVVAWCVENDICITPGCATPTEIMAAMSHGLNVVKFFPANIYGGLAAIKALSGPFGSIKFLPTGGINASNLSDFLKSPSIFAIGGSWMCTSKDISAHEFDKITALCEEARNIASNI